MPLHNYLSVALDYLTQIYTRLLTMLKYSIKSIWTPSMLQINKSLLSSRQWRAWIIYKVKFLTTFCSTGHGSHDRHSKNYKHMLHTCHQNIRKKVNICSKILYLGCVCMCVEPHKFKDRVIFKFVSLTMILNLNIAYEKLWLRYLRKIFHFFFWINYR